MSNNYHELINLEGIDWELTTFLLWELFSEDVAVLWPGITLNIGVSVIGNDIQGWLP